MNYTDFSQLRLTRTLDLPGGLFQSDGMIVELLKHSESIRRFIEINSNRFVL